MDVALRPYVSTGGLCRRRGGHADAARSGVQATGGCDHGASASAGHSQGSGGSLIRRGGGGIWGVGGVGGGVGRQARGKDGPGGGGGALRHGSPGSGPAGGGGRRVGPLAAASRGALTRLRDARARGVSGGDGGRTR